MKQSRLMSLVEAIVNVAVGYGIAVLTQLIVFPWFDLPARVGDALAIGLIFTAVSIARSFALRRLFEAIRSRSTGLSERVGDLADRNRLPLAPICGMQASVDKPAPRTADR